MAITFLADLPPGGTLQIKISGGRYDTETATIAGKQNQWYLRRNLQLSVELPVDALCTPGIDTLKRWAIPEGGTDVGPLKLQVEVLSRPVQEDVPGRRLLTIALVNRT